MPDRSDPLREQVIAYVATWVAHHIGEPTGEITIHEMREFLYQHGFELTPPDEETVFTAMDYWTNDRHRRSSIFMARRGEDKPRPTFAGFDKAVLTVTKDRIRNPDRVISVAWKE